MKKKQLSKKLTLNKKTVAHLDGDKMIQVVAGAGKERCAESAVYQSCPVTSLVICETCKTWCTCEAIACASDTTCLTG